MRNPRISIREELFPVEATLNSLPDSSFPKIVSYFFSNFGYGYNSVGFTFHDSADPENDVPDGFVEFYVMDEVVTIPIEEARSYVRMAISGHLINHPDDRVALEHFLGNEV